MTMKYLPLKKMPVGYRSAEDCIREIEENEGLLATGWHYAYEPSLEEVAYKSKIFYGGAPLVVREIPGSMDIRERSWTLFHKIEEDGSICFPVKINAPAYGWKIETSNAEFNKWVRDDI